MRKGIIGIAVAAGLLTFNLSNAVFGPAGILATDRLKNYQQALSQNQNELQTINLTLNSRVDAITANRRVLETAGHSSGLLGADELRVRIEGLPEPSSYNSPGALIARPIDQSASTASLAVLALAITLVIIVLGHLIIPPAIKKTQRSSGKKPYGQGVRVQTASLE
jgi:hypothetical protein